MNRACLAGLAVTIFALPAVAAPKAKKPSPPSVIELTNGRAVVLRSFTLSTTAKKPKVIAKTAKPLAAGEKTKLRLGVKACEFSARWEFEDAGDESLINLCNDSKIVLTD